MAKTLALLGLCALAACDKPAPRAYVPGQVARATVDAAMTTYATCVYNRAKQLAVPARLPADIVDEAVKACAPGRADLVARVAAFQKIGSPKSTPAYTAAVAEQSVAAMEDEMRAEATTTAVSRQNEINVQ